jgi:DNA polymerase III delta prime subunit
MTENPYGRIEYDNLISLLQTMSQRTNGNKDEDKYMKAAEAFLSHLHETPKTMLQKVNEAKTLKTREALRRHTVREAIFYLDSLVERDEISMSDYAFRSAVIGNFMKLIADFVIKGQ